MGNLHMWKQLVSHAFAEEKVKFCTLALDQPWKEEWSNIKHDALLESNNFKWIEIIMCLIKKQDKAFWMWFNK